MLSSVALDGRITAVGAGAETPVPVDAHILVAEGKFVIPGLADMHNHLGSGAFVSSGEDYPKNLGRLLAYGVTTVFGQASLTRLTWSSKRGQRTTPVLILACSALAAALAPSVA